MQTMKARENLIGELDRAAPSSGERSLPNDSRRQARPMLLLAVVGSRGLVVTQRSPSRAFVGSEGRRRDPGPPRAKAGFGETRPERRCPAMVLPVVGGDLSPTVRKCRRSARQSKSMLAGCTSVRGASAVLKAAPEDEAASPGGLHRPPLPPAPRCPGGAREDRSGEGRVGSAPGRVATSLC